MSLAGIVERRGQGEFQIRRSADPTLDARGVWQPGAISTIRQPLAIWPAGKELLPLPEGIRIEHTIQVHSELPLVITPGRRDRIVFDDGTGEQEFEVWSCNRYEDSEGFVIYEATATKQATP